MGSQTVPRGPVACTIRRPCLCLPSESSFTFSNHFTDVAFTAAHRYGLLLPSTAQRDARQSGLRERADGVARWGRRVREDHPLAGGAPACSDAGNTRRARWRRGVRTVRVLEYSCKPYKYVFANIPVQVCFYVNIRFVWLGYSVSYMHSTCTKAMPPHQPCRGRVPRRTPMLSL